MSRNLFKITNKKRRRLGRRRRDGQEEEQLCNDSFLFLGNKLDIVRVEPKSCDF